MATEQSAGPVVGSGTAEGLFAFLDFLVEKGYGTKNAVSPWKSAARQVLAAVEGDAYESVDVRSIDPDEYMDRFENMTVGQYKTESLASYRSRFKKAIQGYKGYLADRQIPNFRTGGSGGSRRAASPSPAKAQAQQRPPLPSTTPLELPAGDDLVDYPFPLQSGQMVHLYLPSKLAKPDADRLGAFLQTLVLEPQRQIAARTEA